MVATVKKGLRRLLELGVDELYHANSVLTSCQFLKHGALMSRGSIEALGLPQTAQYTDTLDRRYHIWNDVFVDSVDIHKRASRANMYGPVLFVLDTEKLLQDVNSGQIWITRLNPTKWRGKTQEARWFVDADDWDDFDANSFDEMVVFRHMGGILPIRNALKHLVVDAPSNLDERPELDLYSYAAGALKFAMHQGPKQVNVKKRVCVRRCSCETNYSDDEDVTRMMYRPFAKD